MSNPTISKKIQLKIHHFRNRSLAWRHSFNTQVDKFNFMLFGHKTSINFDSDLTMTPLLYPLFVVANNRIIESLISRNHR
jgi:hypothetical protein